MFRIAIVNTHPIQYFAPLYAYLNKDDKLDVTALYCSDVGIRTSVDPGFKQAIKWDVDLLEGYRSVFLGKRASIRVLQGFWSLIVPEVWSEIRSGRYDAVVLHGYNYAVVIIALIAAKTKGLPVFMRGETHLSLRRTSWKWKLHKLILSWYFRLVDGFFVIGTANRQYYRALGVPDTKIFDVPYTVDNERFIKTAELCKPSRNATREKYGLPIDKIVVLYASKFMRRKHPDDVILAAAELRDKGYDFTVFMVGSGETEAELRTLAQERGLTNVVFGGFINQSELPSVYVACDVFVLPSENEPWGLIVNEAMCAGLPVVVSEEVGCVQDLVKDGVNGYHMKAGDSQSLASALKRILDDPEQCARMGGQSLSIIQNWSYEQCRTGILAALTSVIQKPNE